ncbi:DNA helicase II UvrD [Helicobacter trogontum]|uniref:DNA 3'-5' helicase n=1 Tax=Helicobacter trogontum TaxID=50960 RepID=A0ABQ0D5T7_9HELI
MDFLESLNTAQREAATHVDNALLILAGAGSGKTKTLTTRLAYLLSIGIPPQNTLTLTFTNKAAREMRERALRLIISANIPVTHAPLLCTFHKFGLLFLQRHIHLLSRQSLFNVIDEDDKRKILRNLKKNNKNIAKELTPSMLSESISYYKNNAVLPSVAKQSVSAIDMEIAVIYQDYETYLCANNLVDFDDLLLLPYRILYENEALCTQMSNKYQYIMVDEYQDTNNLQASLLKLLCAEHENICVVGDDDQSIYSWRGANIENILDFDTQFKNTKIIKLEQNYRSTEQILTIANNLIAHNATRHNKILKATKPSGKQVQYIKSHNDKFEMKQIIDAIQTLVTNGESYNDIAILFRLNALARNVEECLNRAKIPFKMIGTIRFYDRQEIKDVLAYLRLALNLDDDFSLERIINRPKRNIGEKTFADIIAASIHYASIYAAWKQGALSSLKCYAKLNSFFTLMESLKECLQLHLEDVPQFFKTRIKLYADDLPTKDSENNEERRKNMDELFTSLLDFIEECKKNGDYSSNEEILQTFLNDLTLSSNSDVEDYRSVLCMSVHNSKGLEFKHVFVIGMEQGLFPLEANPDSTDVNIRSLDEERRLAYVAFTRAKETLTISYAKERMYHGKYRYFEPSQFLVESGLVSRLNAKLNDNEMSEDEGSCVVGLKRGDCVQHKIFGFGRVESIHELGNDSSAMVNFGGTKRRIRTSFLTKL